MGLSERHRWSALPLVYLADNLISLLGVLLTTTSGVWWLFTIPAHAADQDSNPYLALLTVVGLPGVFLAGLALIPVGIALKERRKKRAGLYPESFPPIGWQNRPFRHLFLFVATATIVNVGIGGHLTFKAVEYMDSSSFCGSTCHIMTPELTAYQRSPHAQVSCVHCHIGEGAASLIEAKTNGVKQLIGVMLDTFPRPVPAPVHNLAQGKLTCHHCHSERNVGSRRHVWLKVLDDPDNRAERTELNILVGGGDAHYGAHGVHMAEGVKFEYLSDHKRETIPWVRVTDELGRQTVYATPEWRESEGGQGEHGEEYEMRTMDCTDCHNRGGHDFATAEDEIDRAVAEGKLDVTLPWLKRASLQALTSDFTDVEEAAAEIPALLNAYYSKEAPEIAAAKRDSIDAASEELVDIYQRNVFPQFGVKWGTYPNHLGHDSESQGCFRCHDGKHLTEDSREITDICEACHDVVSLEQPVSLAQNTSVDSESLLREAGYSELPRSMSFNTRLGAVPFGHADHVNEVDGNCTTCHTRYFPMNRTPINFGGLDLHRSAQRSRASCAGCHVSGGSAFAIDRNCERCHAKLGTTQVARAPAGPDDVIPKEIVYQTDLGEVPYDHQKHLSYTEDDCLTCHNRLFAMAKGRLHYSDRLHRISEMSQTSCAGCHHKGGSAFSAVGNCRKCHVDLEEEPLMVGGS